MEKGDKGFGIASRNIGKGFKSLVIHLMTLHCGVPTNSLRLVMGPNESIDYVCIVNCLWLE